MRKRCHARRGAAGGLLQPGDWSPPWVIDCLEAALTCPWDEYLAWIATLEAGSEARRKMEGVPKYGEIVIDINHVPMLANAFDKARAAQTSQQQEWSTMLLSMLHDIHQENAIYLMVRRLRD